MALVIIIDLITIVTLIGLARSKSGLERALPTAAFLIVLIPIESLLPFGFFTLTTQRIIVVLLLVLYLTKQTGSAGQSRQVGPMPLKLLMIIHVLWCFVAVINSLDPMMSVKKLLSVLFEYYALCFVCWRTITRVETIHKILMAIVAALIVCSIWGSVEAYQGWDILAYFPAVSHHWGGIGDIDREIRIHATYDHPILYGAALAMGITLDLYLLTVVKMQRQKVFLWIGLLLMFLNIYKTSSRGPWLDVILGCSLLFLLGSRPVRRTMMYIALLSCTVLITRPGVWSTIAGIYHNTFDENTNTGSSFAYRPALQHAAVERLLQNPSSRAIWGYGPESFYDVHLEGMLLGKPHVFLSCDNAWVELMIETGFVGLAIVAVLLLKPMWISWRQYRSLPKTGKYLGLVLFINFTIFYVQMYSVGMYSWGQNGYMLWILIALTLAYSRLNKSRPVHTNQLGAQRRFSSALQAQYAEAQIICTLAEPGEQRRLTV